MIITFAKLVLCPNVCVLHPRLPIAFIQRGGTRYVDGYSRTTTYVPRTYNDITRARKYRLYTFCVHVCNWQFYLQCCVHRDQHYICNWPIGERHSEHASYNCMVIRVHDQGYGWTSFGGSDSANRQWDQFIGGQESPDIDLPFIINETWPATRQTDGYR